MLLSHEKELYANTLIIKKKEV